MSRLFNTAGDNFAITPFTFPNPGCLFFWFYPTTTPGGNVFLFAAVDNSGPQQVFSIFWRASDTTIRAGFFRSGVADRQFGNQGWTLNAWNSVFLVWGQSPQQMEMLVNANDAGARTDWEDAYWDTGAAADYITFGSDNGGAISSCRIAQVTLWNSQAALRESNSRYIAAQLHKGADPLTIFPQYRVAHWPVAGLFSPEPDYSPNVRSATVTGTTVAPGPPVVSGRRLYFPEIVVRRGDLMPMFLGPIAGFGAGA